MALDASGTMPCQAANGVNWCALLECVNCGVRVSGSFGGND